jgi:hypothetical protein
LRSKRTRTRPVSGSAASITHARPVSRCDLY